MSNPVIAWAQENPLVAGVAAIGVVVVVMMLAGGGSSTTSGSDGGAVAAYYAAVGQQTQAGNAVQMAQITQQAETNRTLIAATYGLDTAKVEAGVQSQAIDAGKTVTLDAQQKTFDINNQLWQSNERIAANQIGADVQIATLQRFASKDKSKSSTAQNISAVGGTVSSIAKSILPFF